MSSNRFNQDKENHLTALGFMSGTSMDGVDAAIIETDGKDFVRYVAGESQAFPEVLGAAIRDAVMHMADNPDFRLSQTYAQLEKDFTDFSANVGQRLLDRTGLKNRIDIAGFHGQTLLHLPGEGKTFQMGDGVRLSKTLNLDMVYDFRTDDMAAGGQGAPLLPIYHRALARKTSVPLPTVFCNIGGVANMTYMDEKGTLVAFDTGPGNCLMDDLVKSSKGESFDPNGQWAALGQLHQESLYEMLKHPYFTEPYPKTLDRHAFDGRLAGGLSFHDGLRTLAAFTAETIALALNLLPSYPVSVFLLGGGRHNATLVKEITSRVNVPVKNADDIGLDGDFIEAEGFAYFAVRRLKNLPVTYPSTTGCKKPVVCGTLVQS